ncbi:hypothetical protein [Enterovibrio calviensis]|uniref:hypothetical protein n=1 Tax=Enterovibrio calviensis TaxID=91359 RepID=UPI0004880FD3|nr:hypothetical protein [Enterovibrio calviensis]
MLNFFKSSFDTVAQRITNPLVGAYIMAWLIVNRVGIAAFIFANDNETRIEIVRQYGVGYDELLAILLATGYLVFSYLVSPAVQMFVEKVRFEWIESRDIEVKKVQERVRQWAAFESTADYVQKDFDKQLKDLRAKAEDFDRLEKETEELESNIDAMSSKVDRLEEQETIRQSYNKMCTHLLPSLREIYSWYERASSSSHMLSETEKLLLDQLEQDNFVLKVQELNEHVLFENGDSDQIENYLDLGSRTDELEKAK